MKAADYDRASTDLYHAIRQLCCLVEEQGYDKAARSLSQDDYDVLKKLLATAVQNHPAMFVA